MAETAIEWTHQRLPDGRVVPGYSANAWSGCTKVLLPSGKPDPQCLDCYAEREEDTRRHRSKWGKGRPRTKFKGWRDNLAKWNRAAAKAGTTPFVFIQSLSDWADEEVPDEWRDELFAVLDKCTNLIPLLLTKHVAYAAAYLRRRYGPALPPHFWFGWSAGDVEGFSSRASAAAYVQASRRFISIEPYAAPFAEKLQNAIQSPFLGRPLVDWILTGGKTAEFARVAADVAHSSWYTDLRDVAIATGTPFHFKQWGNLAPVDQSQSVVVGALGVAVRRNGLRVTGQVFATRVLDRMAYDLFAVDEHRYPHEGRADERENWELHHFLGGSAGKHAHGRLLEGVEWHQHPEVKP